MHPFYPIAFTLGLLADLRETQDSVVGWSGVSCSHLFPSVTTLAIITKLKISFYTECIDFRDVTKSKFIVLFILLQ